MTIAKNSNLIVSVCTVFVVPVEDVQTISAGADRFHQVVALKGGKSWTEIYFTPSTGEFTEKSKDTDAGTLYEQSLKLQFPGEDDTNLAELEAIADRPLLVAIQLSEGTYYKLIGSLENGAKLNPAIQLSSKGSGSVLEFYCQSSQKACWITAF